MKKFVNTVSRYCYNRSTGLLLIRIVTGLIFLVHGWGKVESIDKTLGFIASLGFGPYTGYFIAWLEVVGGIALILGFATRFFGLLLGIEMLVAVSIHLGKGFNSYQWELLLAATSLALAFAGSGAYSLFRMECEHCGGMCCKGKPGVCPKFSSDTAATK